MSKYTKEQIYQFLKDGAIVCSDFGLSNTKTYFRNKNGYIQYKHETGTDWQYDELFHKRIRIKKCDYLLDDHPFVKNITVDFSPILKQDIEDLLNS